MIPLQFNKLEKEKKSQIIEEYSKKVIANRNKDKIKDIDDWCVSNLTIDGEIYNFQKVINAEYDELIKIKNYIDSNRISMESFF